MLKKIGHQILWWFFILLIGYVFFLAIDFSFPRPDAAKLKKFSQLVVDRNGLPLRAFADKNGVWRYPTRLEKVSPNYIDALINYEDREFWRHRGINPFSLIRAVTQLLRNGRTISGGSTITMQVARILEPHKKTIAGKLWQMFRAFQLEYYLDKKQILELYLNYAPFGGPIEGIEAATFTYLGKSAIELTHAEAALMAVLPQSPSRFRPDRYPQRAEKARNKVLTRLQTYSVWSDEIIKQAKQEVVYAEFNSRPLNAPLLARRLIRQYPEQAIIHSTIDLDIQIQIADQIRTSLQQFSDTTSAAALLMNNQTLDVVAYVGTGVFADKKRFGHIDMNQAIRSPGSTLKPFIYGMAMDEQLIHSESLLQDVPLNFQQYSPKNFSRNFNGPVSVSRALQQSLNIPAVQVLSHFGVEKFTGQLANAGLKLYLPDQSKPNLSIALGGAGVKLEQLVTIYRALAAGGMSGKPNFVKGGAKRELYLLSKESAWIIGEILSKISLSSFQRKGITERTNQWVAHKTGTSYGYRDAWMITVTASHTLAVWIGKPDGSPSPGEYGRKTVGPLVKKILAIIPENHQKRPVKPNKVKSQVICWPIGKLKESQKQAHCLQQKNAWIINNVSPLTLKENNRWWSNPITIQVAEHSKMRVYSSCYHGVKSKLEIAVWPSRLEFWLPSKWHYENRMPRIHPDCKDKLDLNQRLIIIGLENGSRISQPPGRTGLFEISLSVTAGQGEVTWLKNGELIGKSVVGDTFLITGISKGHQKILVFDRGGNVGSVEFDVL